MQRPDARTLSLFELNEHVRRAVALNFLQPVWVKAEVAEASCSKGHFFLRLAEKAADSDELLAVSEAILWQNSARKIDAELGPGFVESALAEGRELVLRVKVEFHERFGLRLFIEEIDAAHALGQWEVRRRRIVESLRAERLFERNKALRMPLAPQKIAVLSASTAAGLQDFQKHLAENPFGYRFELSFFETSVQGRAVETELAERFEALAARSADFDCAVLVRGGGARLDLAAFDSLELCRAAARLPLPLLTGIGHEVDETALDLVAFAALKTPTAVADFLTNRCAAFESELHHLASMISSLTADRLKNKALALDNAASQIRWSARERLRWSRFLLERKEAELPVLVVGFLQKKRARLDELEAVRSALDPQTALRRGFSMTFKNGRLVRSATEVEPGDRLSIRFFDGETTAETSVSEKK